MSQDQRFRRGGSDPPVDRKEAQTSSVAIEIRCLILPKLSIAGRTSREKTGEPSGSGGAE